MFNEYTDLLTVEELCDILQVGKNTAYDILNSQEIKAFKAGRVWKIPKIAVEDYILTKSGLKSQ